MDKVSELKEIIVDLKLDLIEASLPDGYCPYSIYKPSGRIKLDCNIGCNKCRQKFMLDMEKSIREEVKAL